MIYNCFRDLMNDNEMKTFETLILALDRRALFPLQVAKLRLQVLR